MFNDDSVHAKYLFEELNIHSADAGRDFFFINLVKQDDAIDLDQTTSSVRSGLHV